MPQSLHRTFVFTRLRPCTRLTLIAVMLIGCGSGCTPDGATTTTGRTAPGANQQPGGQPLPDATSLSPSPSPQTNAPTLTDDADERGQQAATAPASAETDDEESLDALLAGLGRSIGGNRFAVSLNKRGEPAIPRVLEALQSEDATTRENAAFCCGLTWSTAQADRKIAALSRVAEHDTDSKVRHQAAIAMAILARHDDVDPQLKITVVPTLRSSLQDTSAATENRRHLAGVIGGMGHKGHPLIPAMITLLKDEDAMTRSKAANAVGLLASPFPIEQGKVVPDGDQPEYRADQEATDLAVTALIAALSDNDAKVRAEAARGLSHIGPAAASAAPALRQQLQEEEETESRLRAAESLVRIAADPSAAIPVLQEAATDESGQPQNRWWKARAQRLLEDLDRTKTDRAGEE